MSAHTPEERTLMAMMEVVLKKLDLISFQIPAVYIMPPKKTSLEKHAPEMFELLKEAQGIVEQYATGFSVFLETSKELIQKIEGESPHDPEKPRNKNE